jgi:hypothetical protein
MSAEIDRVMAELRQAAAIAAQGTPSSEERQAAAVEHMRMLNDQLEVFHAVRRIVSAPFGSGAADLEAIRQLYRNFDRKHPPAKEIQS